MCVSVVRVRVCVCMCVFGACVKERKRERETVKKEGEMHYRPTLEHVDTNETTFFVSGF